MESFEKNGRMYCVTDDRSDSYNPLRLKIQGGEKTIAFHIRIGCELIAGFRQFPCVQLTGRGYYCAKGEFHGNFYCFTYSRNIIMYVDSNSELNLCFRLINGSFIWYASYTHRVSTSYLHKAVFTGSGIGQKRETKNFWKDCIIYVIHTEPSPNTDGEIEGDFPSKWKSCIPMIYLGNFC